jgi:hypothetical protein
MFLLSIFILILILAIGHQASLHSKELLLWVTKHQDLEKINLNLRKELIILKADAKKELL